MRRDGQRELRCVQPQAVSTFNLPISSIDVLHNVIVLGARVRLSRLHWRWSRRCRRSAHPSVASRLLFIRYPKMPLKRSFDRFGGKAVHGFHSLCVAAWVPLCRCAFSQHKNRNLPHRRHSVAAFARNVSGRATLTTPIEMKRTGCWIGARLQINSLHRGVPE